MSETPERGPVGDTGQRGQSGEQGIPGIVGLGIQGERGATGDHGQTGATGETGRPGRAGKSVTPFTRIQTLLLVGSILLALIMMALWVQASFDDLNNLCEEVKQHREMWIETGVSMEPVDCTP